MDEIEDNDWQDREMADGRARFDPNFVRFVSTEERVEREQANFGLNWTDFEYGPFDYRRSMLVPRGDDQPSMVKFYDYLNHVSMCELLLLLFASKQIE